MHDDIGWGWVGGNLKIRTKVLNVKKKFGNQEFVQRNLIDFFGNF